MMDELGLDAEMDQGMELEEPALPEVQTDTDSDIYTHLLTRLEDTDVISDNN